MCHAVLAWTAYIQAYHRLDAGLPLTKPLFIPHWFHATSLLIVVVSFYWNGMFFLDRVIVSHTQHLLGVHKKTHVDVE